MSPAIQPLSETMRRTLTIMGVLLNMRDELDAVKLGLVLQSSVGDPQERMRATRLALLVQQLATAITEAVAQSPDDMWERIIGPDFPGTREVLELIKKGVHPHG